MKMKAEHYAFLVEKFTLAIPHLDNFKKAILAGKYPKDPNKRLRWDILWACQASFRTEFNTWFGEVYKYLNDDHIDTALRKVCKELNISFCNI